MRRVEQRDMNTVDSSMLKRSDIVAQVQLLTEELREIDGEIHSRQWGRTEYQALMTKRATKVKQIQRLQSELTKLKALRIQSENDEAHLNGKRVADTHLLWCSAFVDAAKKMLPQSTFSVIRKEASRQRQTQEIIAVEMALSETERVVLPLFAILGTRKPLREIKEQAIERTDLHENELMEALASLSARGLVEQSGDYYTRHL